MTSERSDRARNRPLAQSSAILAVATPGPGFTEITPRIAQWLGTIGALDGVLTVFIRHTSASLTIQENADPDVQSDLLDALERVAPRGTTYRHVTEGADDMPAHIRAMLTATDLNIPVQNGRALLGTWQGVYVVEHRDRPHSREVVLSFLGTHREG